MPAEKDDFWSSLETINLNDIRDGKRCFSDQLIDRISAYDWKTVPVERGQLLGEATQLALKQVMGQLKESEQSCIELRTAQLEQEGKASVAPSEQDAGTLLSQIGSLREGNVHLYHELDRQTKEIELLKRQAQNAVSILQSGAPSTSSRSTTPPPAASKIVVLPADPKMFLPKDHPPAFDPALCGQTLELHNDNRTAVATKQFSKTVLLNYQLNGKDTYYIEFKLETEFARYLGFGIVRDPCVMDLDRHCIGDSMESWGYFGHNYWMAPLRFNEESSGPRDACVWKPGDVVGVLLCESNLSFYLNGKPVIKNGFVLPAEHMYRFAVSFGGKPVSDQLQFGTVSIVA